MSVFFFVTLIDIGSQSIVFDTRTGADFFFLSMFFELGRNWAGSCCQLVQMVS